MKTSCLIALWLLTAGVALAKPPELSAGTNWVTTRFEEIDKSFFNPGQGWMSQERRPRPNPRFPYSVVYVRFNWADAEPSPGQYQWSIIDDAINAWKSRGATVGVRVMTCNAHSSGYYSSPQWLFDTGCKGFEYEVGGDDPTSGGVRIKRIEPDYADPIYLARHGEFLSALGKRYDGSADIEFLDIGSYGIWGEWHTKHPVSIDVRKKIVDLYLAAFKKTPMVFMSDDAEVLGYALAHGTGFRRDGVGSPWHEENWIGSKRYASVTGMAETWKHAPVVFEWFGDCDYMKSRNWSVEAAVNFMLSNHVTLINDNVGRIPPETMPLIDKLAKLAGARFVLREVGNARSVAPGQKLHLVMDWANVGLGKLYRDYVLRLGLLNAKDDEVVSLDGKADPRQWLPGEYRVEEDLLLPAEVSPGDYTITMALVDRAGQRPPFQIATNAKQVDGRYVIGAVRILRAQ